METRKIGIIICDRYRRCAGGKCLRALKNREGAFGRYENCDVELVGYTSCDGCPGGNIEYAVDEMLKNGVNTVHFAKGCWSDIRHVHASVIFVIIFSRNMM